MTQFFLSFSLKALNQNLLYRLTQKLNLTKYFLERMSEEPFIQFTRQPRRPTRSYPCTWTWWNQGFVLQRLRPWFGGTTHRTPLQSSPNACRGAKSCTKKTNKLLKRSRSSESKLGETLGCFNFNQSHLKYLLF